MELKIATDGSMNSSGMAGSAAIIRYSKEFLPIKILSFIGQLESSQAELWSAILAFGMLKILKIENKVNWISDSQTTLNYFSKNLDIKNSPKHIVEWDLLEKLSTELIVCCKYSNSHKDLISCDKASRWAANIGQTINTQKSLAGKNLTSDQRYAWQPIDLTSVFKASSDDRMAQLCHTLSIVKLYPNSSTSEYSQQ